MRSRCPLRWNRLCVRDSLGVSAQPSRAMHICAAVAKSFAFSDRADGERGAAPWAKANDYTFALFQVRDNRIHAEMQIETPRWPSSGKVRNVEARMRPIIYQSSYFEKLIKTGLAVRAFSQVIYIIRLR